MKYQPLRHPHTQGGLPKVPTPFEDMKILFASPPSFEIFIVQSRQQLSEAGPGEEKGRSRAGAWKEQESSKVGVVAYQISSKLY